MAQMTATTDGGNDNEHKSADLDTIVVDLGDIVTAMRRNKRDETEQRSHVLRVTPPFEGERTANLHVSEAHTFYPPEMDPKPLHLTPEAFLAGHDAGSRHPDFRDEWRFPDHHEERSLFRDEFDARDEHGENRPLTDDEQDEWDEWWVTTVEMWEGRVRTALTDDELTLTSQHPDIEDTTVTVRFEDTADE